MKFGLKWVHMARYDLILKLDGALWLRIIFKPLLTPKRHIKIQKCPKRNEGRAKRGPELLVLCICVSLRNRSELAQAVWAMRGGRHLQG